jgi:hypothetical protein
MILHGIKHMQIIFKNYIKKKYYVISIDKYVKNAIKRIASYKFFIYTL